MTHPYRSSNEGLLVRSILLSQSALTWLRQALADAMHLQPIVKPRWLNRLELLPYQASILSNPKGRFIRVVEYLPDGRATFICIPEGYRCSCWSTFQQYIIHYSDIQFPQPFQDEIVSFIIRQPYLLHPNRFQKPITLTISWLLSGLIIPQTKPKPWDNPKDSINLFANYISHSDMSIPSFRDDGWLLFVTGHTITLLTCA